MLYGDDRVLCVKNKTAVVIEKVRVGRCLLDLGRPSLSSVSTIQYLVGAKYK